MPIANLRSLAPPRATPLTRKDLVLPYNMLLYDPVLALPCQEGAGTTVYDITGYANDGAFLGAGQPAWLQLPNGLWVLRFDGSNDIVTVPHNVSLEPADAITVMGWFNPIVLDNADGWVEKSNNISLNGYGFFWYNNVLRFWINHYDVWYASAALSTANQWYFVVGTYDKVNIRIYLGAVEGTSRAYAVAIAASGAGLTIAREAGYNKWAQIDSWGHRVLNGVALPLAQIQNIYNREKHYLDIFNGNILARLLQQRQLAVVR